jgi:hypothetical protein
MAWFIIKKLLAYSLTRLAKKIDGDERKIQTGVRVTKACSKKI